MFDPVEGDFDRRSMLGSHRKMYLVGDVNPVQQIFGRDSADPVELILVKEHNPPAVNPDCRRPFCPVRAREGRTDLIKASKDFTAHCHSNIFLTWIECFI